MTAEDRHMTDATRSKRTGSAAVFWMLVWGLGIAGQICWNMENQWFNTFIYARIAKDPTIISWMTACSAAATAISTFLFGTLTDRLGKRKPFIAIGYILWGIFTILFGMTQFLTGSAPSEQAQIAVGVGAAVVAADTVMSFFGSMGNDSGFNAWINDNMTDDNRGQLGAAMATQPVLGTIFGTIIGGLLVGSDDNYMRLFSVMGVLVILMGIASGFSLRENPGCHASVRGTFGRQFLSIFNFRKYGEMHELVWVNWTLTVFFIAFNIYFLHIGNFVIYYLGFTADQLGIIEGVSLILSMFSVIPATRLINRGRIPAVAAAGILLNCAGCSILALFVRPETVDTSTLFNPLLILGVFLIGTGYILFLQTLTVWSKQLYPQDSRGQFEGIRILFFVLIPMIIAPLISNPVIRGSGKFTDADGFTEYLPTHTLYGISVFLVLAAFIPLAFAARWYRRRLQAEHTHS